MPSVMPVSLQNTKNEWMAIREQSKSQEELDMSLYLRALQNDCFSMYKKKFVYIPEGWIEANDDYARTTTEVIRIKLRQSILEKFGGFIRARDNAEAENSSNKKFLKKMMDFFNERKMNPQAEKCRLRLFDFESIA